MFGALPCTPDAPISRTHFRTMRHLRTKYFVQNFLESFLFFLVKNRVNLSSWTPFLERLKELACVGFSCSGASKIDNRRPPGRSGSRDKFVTLRSYSAATETLRPPHHTLFPRILQKHLLLPKGCQNRYLRASNSLYSRSYGQYKVPPLSGAVPRQPAGEHTC